MSPFFLAFLLALATSVAYAAGRMHGQVGYRTGYRQGHSDRAKEQFDAGVRAFQIASRRNGGPVYVREGVPRGRAAVGAGVSVGNGARHRRQEN
ncbi:hypothetical protein [Plantactinospora sp. CA-290183]|uniref:hypothetical protein n=1 Tax=Plantactinospora sp. CA-290183 TaxID=3240006 RepID=UPI003D90327E